MSQECIILQPGQAPAHIRLRAEAIASKFGVDQIVAITFGTCDDIKIIGAELQEERDGRHVPVLGPTPNWRNCRYVYGGAIIQLDVGKLPQDAAFLDQVWANLPLSEPGVAVIHGAIAELLGASAYHEELSSADPRIVADLRNFTLTAEPTQLLKDTCPNLPVVVQALQLTAFA